MRVADFFCGAGGFSEGFREKGFEVVFALDNWRPAQETHKFNHPGCRHPGLDCYEDLKGDILAIPSERIDEIVPDTEVIVGSPPCVSFSGSNKAGKADKTLGIMLIEKYLQIVAVKKHKPGSVLKYWVLENVPNSGKYVKDKYTFSDLALDDALLKRMGIRKKASDVALDIKRRGVFNAADYGAPQTRTRFLCGEFPEPIKTRTQKEWVTMRHVMETLGSPDKKKRSEVEDPVLGFKIPADDLTDHFYDTRVEVHEWKRARHLKEDHSFMGVMSFPERLDRPSRTVMATQSAISRESILFGTEKQHENNGESYRLPTIREIGCFMGFPVTYQFVGNNESVKYKLIGNAVCVPMSAAVAAAIKKDAGWKLPEKPNPHPAHKEPPYKLDGRKRKRREPAERRIIAKFQMHTPYLKIRSFRVDLDNLDSDFTKERFIWKARIHQGSGMKSWKKAEPTLAQAEKLIDQAHGATTFKKAVEKEFRKLPDARTLQERYCHIKDGEGPEEILECVKKVVDEHYPESKFAEAFVPNNNRIIKIEKDAIPTRIAAALYATTFLAKQIS